MHPDQHALKETQTEKVWRGNGFSVYLGLVQTSGAYQPHPPQFANWGTFPRGEGVSTVSASGTIVHKTIIYAKNIGTTESLENENRRYCYAENFYKPPQCP